MEIKYFGEIDPENAKEYYEHQAIIDGCEIELDLNFIEEEINEESLIKANKLLENLSSVLKNAINDISKDYDLGENSDAVKDYLEHHLDVFEPEEIQTLFGTKDVSKALFMSKLEIKRVGLYPDDDEDFVIVDVTFQGDITDYVLAVAYSENNELSYISMDS